MRRGVREVVQVKSPTFNSRSEQVGALGVGGGAVLQCGCCSRSSPPQPPLLQMCRAGLRVRDEPGLAEGRMLGGGGGGGSKLLLVVECTR